MTNAERYAECEFGQMANAVRSERVASVSVAVSRFTNSIGSSHRVTVEVLEEYEEEYLISATAPTE